MHRIGIGFKNGFDADFFVKTLYVGLSIIDFCKRYLNDSTWSNIAYFIGNASSGKSIIDLCNCSFTRDYFTDQQEGVHHINAIDLLLGKERIGN